MNIPNNINILLVEDNPTDAEMTIRSFKKNNLDSLVFHVNDGAEALDLMYLKGEYSDFNISGIKLILLDLKLPKIGGLEVLKILKNDPNKKEIPIVILTSSAEEKDIVEGYKLYANSYIVKPVDFTQFSKAIQDIGYYWLSLNKYKP